MKKTIAAILATLLASLCLVMIGRSMGYGGMQAEGWESLTDDWVSSSVVRTTRADDEDLLSHFTGDIRAYYHYLLSYFADVTGCNYPEDWGSTIMKRLSDEMIKISNEYYNDIDDHPYLCGTIDEDTGEVTITGLKKAGYVTPYYPYWEGLYLSEYDVGYNGIYIDMNVKHLVIPDEFDGHPVTKIADYAFALFYPEADNPGRTHFSSVVIGDNVREIGNDAFSAQHVTIQFGKSVETIGIGAFGYAWNGEIRITDWGESLKTIDSKAFIDSHISAMPPFPDTLETIEEQAFWGATLPETVILPPSVQSIDYRALDARGVNHIVLLHRDTPVEFGGYGVFPYFGDNNKHIYCYAGSTAEAELKRNRYSYILIDGDSLLWDGEAVEETALKNCVGMTETELRSHLSIDGTSSEIQIDGLQDGKVVNGTTVTLFHTVARAPGKVYRVRTPGDADGDGKLTLLDAAQLLRYIVGGWGAEIDPLNADVNDDGIVDLKDAALIQRHLAGWDVTLQ